MASTSARRRRPLLYLLIAGFVVGVVWLTRAAWRPSRIGGGAAAPSPQSSIQPSASLGQGSQRAPVPATVPITAPTVVPEPPAAPAASHASTTGLDNLTRIEGIGPKIAAALATEGVSTFEALAAATPEQLRASLAGHGLRFAPSLPTWPEQARQFRDLGSAPR